MELSSIVSEVQQYSTPYVTVTGGEPLAQKNCLPLLKQLCDLNYRVSLETSGALDVSGVDRRVMKILDIKTPASGEVEKNLWANVEHLNETDEIKFVLCDQGDYLWAKQILAEYKLAEKCTVLFSPSQGQLHEPDLADWILRDALPVRFQMQLHKLLWGNVAGR
jgi:7-carboxy-7-deazaguanine synthase